MINNKDNLFIYLVVKFPSFNEWWKSEDNCNVLVNGEYTIAGLCAEFSQFYTDSFENLDDICIRDLFFEIEKLLAENPKNSITTDLSNSLKSCFLENIAQTIAGEESIKYMGQLTITFFEGWHGGFNSEVRQQTD